MFLGEVANPELYYRNLFDINVSSSRSEALGLTIIEGSACALPSIVPNVGGLPEIVDSGESGYVFQKENVDDLADKLLKLIINSDLRKRMGIKGREKAIKCFSLGQYIRNVEKEILDLL